jgi:hypothetical protein
MSDKVSKEISEYMSGLSRKRKNPGAYLKGNSEKAREIAVIRWKNYAKAKEAENSNSIKENS